MFEPTSGQISDYLARKECGSLVSEDALIAAYHRWQDRVTGLGERIASDGQSVVIEITPTQAEAAAIEAARVSLRESNEALFAPGADKRLLSIYLQLYN